MRVDRAVRKPKPTGQRQAGANRFNQTAKKIFSGKKATAAKSGANDGTQTKKSFGVGGAAFKKPFRAKFKKSAANDQNKKSFQGFTTSVEGVKKFKKPRWNKDDKRKKIIAEKLAS